MNETIKYAINGWSHWCLYGINNSNLLNRYISCKLDIFEVLTVLHSGRIKYEKVDGLKSKLLDALILHSSLFPPSEQTYALHEIIHVTEQIEQLGPPVFNSLYMYERLNLFLKRLNKNKNNSLASIVRHYSVSLYYFNYFK